MVEKPVEIKFLQIAEQVKNSFLQQGLSQWILGRLPECAIFALGVFLRLTMTWRYDVTWGYDAPYHWEYAQWLIKHHSLPPMSGVLEAFHPPLYYVVIAGLVKLGASHQGLTWLSIACGVARLGLVWIGLEWYLKRRASRLAALSLAAVIPASVHVDGIVYPEPMSGLLAVAAMLLWVRAFRATGRRQWQFACALGLIFGLGLLTKVSALALMVTLGMGVLLELLWPAETVDWRIRLKTLVPWSAALAICLAVAGWFYARNVAQYGKPFLTSFDTSQSSLVTDVGRLPYLDRRTLGFVFGWDMAIYRQPYYPSGLYPRARFFPVALASTFVDYYDYGFSGMRPFQWDGVDPWASKLPLTRRLVWLSRGAVLGGTVILLGTLVAWAVCLGRAFRRDWRLFALLLAPLVTTLFALHFAVQCPYDTTGVIKGAYMQFGAPPLYAMFGVSVGWAASRRRRWIVLAILLLGLSLVAAYTFCCRTGLLL